MQQGQPPDIVGARYWTDAALVGAHDIPVAVFGPGGHGIHSDEEWISIEDLVTCSATLAGVMAEFGCNGAPQMSGAVENR